MPKREFEDNTDVRNSKQAKVIMDEKDCDETVQWKWKYLFGDLPAQSRSQIQMDDVALFSVTKAEQAKRVTELLLNILPPYASLCDGTACVGGNTISFAQRFDHIISLEIDSNRYKMLNHNLSVYNVSSKVKTLNQDFLTYMETLDYHDCIFMDPPWGGEDYDKYEHLHLYLSKEDVGDVCFRLNTHCRYIVMKVPSNFDNDDFIKKSGLTQIYEEHFDISKKKRTYWILYIYEFYHNKNGRFLHTLPPIAKNPQARDLFPSNPFSMIPSSVSLIQSPCFVLSVRIVKYIHQSLQQIQNTQAELCYNEYPKRYFPLSLIEAFGNIGSQTVPFSRVTPSFSPLISLSSSNSLQELLKQYRIPESSVHSDMRTLEELVDKKEYTKMNPFPIYFDFSSFSYPPPPPPSSSSSNTTTTTTSFMENNKNTILMSRNHQPFFQFVNTLFLNPSQYTPLIIACVPRGYEDVLLKYCFYGAFDLEYLEHEDCRSSLHEPGKVSLVTLYRGNPCECSNRQICMYLSNYPNGKNKLYVTIQSIFYNSKDISSALYNMIINALELWNQQYDTLVRSPNHIYHKENIYTYSNGHQSSCSCISKNQTLNEYMDPSSICRDSSVYNQISQYFQDELEKNSSLLNCNSTLVGTYSHKIPNVIAIIGNEFKPKRILCVGGIYGHITKELGEYYSISKDNLVLLSPFDRRINEKCSYTYIPYTKGHFPLEDHSFDLIIGICLHDFEENHFLASEISRVLSNHGYFVLYDHHVSLSTERLYLDIVHTLIRDIFSKNILLYQYQHNPNIFSPKIKEEDILNYHHNCCCFKDSGYKSNYEWSQLFESNHLKRIDNENAKLRYNVRKDRNNLYQFFWAAYQKNV